MSRMINRRLITAFLYTMCLFCSGQSFATVLISTTVNNGGFESGAAGWTLTTGQTNQWYVDAYSFCTGTKGAYIANSLSPTSNTYDVNSPSVSHIYKDITFPANESQITLTFDFKGQGESSFDFMRVSMVPTSIFPAPGTQLQGTYKIGNGRYNLIGSCTNYSINLDPLFAGTTQRLVFTWINDGSLGTNPPATLDNVTITSSSPAVPTCAGIVSPLIASSGACASGITLNWSAPLTGSAPTGYQLFFGTNNPPTTLVNGTNVGNVLSYNPGSLLPNTTYYWKVVPVNSAGAASSCAVWSFTTGSNCFIQAAGANYVGCSGSFYDPGGVAGNYPNSNNSVTTICPTAGQYLTATFNSFNLESCCDNLSIYNGNSNASSLLGNYTGTVLPTCISSTAANGCLTFSFTSDASIVYSGWDATISCTSTPSGCLPSCATIGVPAAGTTGVCTNGQSLTWSAPTGGSAPTGYLLYYGTNNPPTNIVNGTNIGNALSYTPATMSANTTYYWKVVPTNASGSASNCPVWSFTTGGSCIIQSNGVTYTACSGNYYDSGGLLGNYSNSESSVTTICPSSPGQFLQLNFASLNLESGFDNLRIYNGNSVSAPLLGNYSGTTSPCVLTSTAAGNGCLTMQFSSDGSINYNGWAATISCVAAAAPTLPGSTCSNAPVISLPYSAAGTTSCYGNDYSNVSVGSCGTLYESGEDRVYAVSVASPQCLSISLTNASTSFIGYQVYYGCPGTGTCITSNGGSANLSGSVTLPVAGIYYIIVDTWAPPASATYTLSVAASGSTPSNDSICAAITLPLNINLSGTNACSGALGDPAPPTCWINGAVNSVWYRITAPASGQLRIRTTLGTNGNTQIALYSGTCSTPTMVGCNTNAPSCGTSTYENSEISATGLTPGAVYLVAVDGEGSATGTFDIMAVDGAIGFPPAAGQDCSYPNPVCDSTITIGNPGYQAYGNLCDFPGGGGNCLLSGERGSAWYSIPITSNGFLSFSIVPNDWPGVPSTSGTDYDFAIWRVVGAGATTCAGISAGAVPIACNYSYLGITGLYGTTTATAPPQYPGFGGAFVSQIPVVAGETYLLSVSNFSNSQSGFSLYINPSAPITYTGTASSVVWTGGTNTAWALASNWGGCSAPVCGISGTISPSATNQPILLSGTTYTVNNLTIDPGASLTMQAGSTLQICGNFTNNGSLVAAAGATILFNGTGVQTVSGALVGPDKFPNLSVNKTSGSVLLNNDIDIGGNFLTINPTSVFNSNGKYVRVAGNFTNNAGNTTFSNTGVTGVLEFNGTSAQIYSQGTTQLDLNIVSMNHTGPGVTINSHLVMKPATGQLNLTRGIISTGANEVRQYNTAATSVTTGLATSYVQGNLRRWINSSGSYDFPVGDVTKGYERANVNITGTTINNLMASFQSYSAIPLAINLVECNRRYNWPALDDGKWIINAYNNLLSPITGDGTYAMTLYNRVGSYTNNAGSAWTIMKDPTGSGAWVFNGVCDTMSTVNSVRRTAMTGFSHFGTAQGGITLPIELIRFDGRNDFGTNVLYWTTASEINNDYFTLMRSKDGTLFEPIGRIEGAGNSHSILNYEFVDEHPYAGMNYYELGQTDFDGTKSLSDIIAIRTKAKDFSILSLRPNPNNGRVLLDFFSESVGAGLVKVTDLTGRLQAKFNVTIQKDINTFSLDLVDLAKGIYSISVVSEVDGKISTPQLMVRQ